MSTPNSGLHSTPGPPSSERPAVPEPSYAERARTLVYRGRLGSLSTHSRKHPGFPFGSIMPYSPDEQGRPVFLISSMAMHTQNLAGDARASLLVAEPDLKGDPLGASRVTLLGNTTRVPESELTGVRERYLAHYENAHYWVNFSDFAFYRLEVTSVYFVGGFGVMGWVAAGEYGAAAPDPLADFAAGIVARLNADHASDLLLLAQFYGGAAADSAMLISVDRLGLQLRLRDREKISGIRIAFVREAQSDPEMRTVLAEMVRRAKLV